MMFSESEWNARVNLSACYRLAHLLKWDDAIYTHITCKVPGEDNSLLINCFGMLFQEVTASNLIKIDYEGNILSGPSESFVNKAAIVIHTVIHKQRPDAFCVIHTHSLNGVAVSACSKGLLPISQQSTAVMSSLSYHDYGGIFVDKQEQKQLINDLGCSNFMILRNHGLLVVGSSIGCAFERMYHFERACFIQTKLNFSDELIMIDSKIIQQQQQKFDELTNRDYDMCFQAFLKVLDRTDASYKI